MYCDVCMKKQNINDIFYKCELAGDVVCSECKKSIVCHGCEMEEHCDVRKFTKLYYTEGQDDE